MILIVIFHPPAADRSRDSPGELAPIVRGWNIVSTLWKKIIQKVPWKKKHKKTSSSLWHVVFGTFHDNKRHISVLRFEKKGQNPTNWWKVLDILVAIHFRFRWTKFLWTVAVRKEVMAGGLMKGEETVGPEAVDPRMHPWGTWRDRWGSWGVQGAEMIWLNCFLGQKEVISMWYIWIWVPMWYIWIWVSDV